MGFERVTFPNGRGQALAGRLELPTHGEPIAYALYAHCFTCTKSLRAIGRITDTLAHHGVATLRFDFTGLGESEGAFADTNFSTTVADLLAAAGFLRSRDRGPDLLIGHSLGGTAALAAAGSIPEARAVATIGAPANPSQVKRHLECDLEAIESQGRAEILLAGRPFEVTQQFIDDIDRTDLTDTIRELRRALLVLHSPIDNTVGIDNAAEILEAARHPKNFISLDGADHLITDDADARYVAEMIAAWADRYVAGDLTAHLQPDFSAAAPESVTVVELEEGYRTRVVSNGFPLIADEPVAVGGTNTGPAPYDYLLTALGACTAMTLRMYAERKEWPLESVSVRLSHRKVHARDCEECESETGFIDRIDRSVRMTGPLDGTQRARLLEIADRCPVHRTLHNEVIVDTTEAT